MQRLGCEQWCAWLRSCQPVHQLFSSRLLHTESLGTSILTVLRASCSVNTQGQDPELSDTLIDPHITSWLQYAKYISGVFFWVDRVGTLWRHATKGVAGIDLVSEFYFRSDRCVRVCKGGCARGRSTPWGCRLITKEVGRRARVLQRRPLNNVRFAGLTLLPPLR